MSTNFIFMVFLQTELAIDYEDQLESMTDNMSYIQSNVTECQNSIMQMEEEAKVTQDNFSEHHIQCSNNYDFLFFY